MRKELGRYIVMDSSICRGAPTFRGTRIFVADVLEQLVSGMTRDAIIHEWRGSVSKSAIVEAVKLANDGVLEGNSRTTLIE